MPYFDFETFLAHWGVNKSDLEGLVRQDFEGLVYLSGSAVQGHATTASDLDLYVVRAAGSASLQLDFPIAKSLKIPLDTTEIEEGWLLALIRGFASVTRTDPVPRLPLGTSPAVALETLCRFLHSIPLIGQARYSQLKAELDERKVIIWRQHVCLEASEKAITDATALEALGEAHAARWAHFGFWNKYRPRSRSST